MARPEDAGSAGVGHELGEELEEDDEALRWEGDDDRGQIRPARRGTEAVADDGSGDGADIAVVAVGAVSRALDDEPPIPSRPVRTALTAFFALVYLLATLGWVLTVQRAGSSQTELVFAVLDQFGKFTAIVAAPLWFGAVLTLTRDSRTVTRIGWLALGTAILVPWPLILAVLATAGGAS